MAENNNNESANILAKKIAEGTANREERGLSLKMINTQLAIEMVTGLEDVKNYVEKIKAVREKLSEKFINKIEEQIAMDDIDPELMFQYMNSISNKELQLLGEYRKLLQGNRQLFDEDAMSEEDRLTMRLLRSFSSVDQKREFFNLVTQYMRDKNMQDASVVE